MSGNKKFPRTHAGRLAADMVLRYYTHDVARDSAALDAMSPLKVLGRGYAVARNEAGQVLKSSGETHIGERIHVTLGSGGLTAVVDHIEEARNGG